ncbi:MAG: hypothetical protein KC420_20120, partial [Myxococcales bacterium]|nr:hypothetical protein [Myxococcales bacterium]
IRRALDALADDAPAAIELVAGLAALRGGFEARREALHELVREAFDELREGDPRLAAAHPPLPAWDVSDDEDAALARAAGADPSALLRRITPLVLLALAFIAAFVALALLT